VPAPAPSVFPQSPHADLAMVAMSQQIQMQQTQQILGIFANIANNFGPVPAAGTPCDIKSIRKEGRKEGYTLGMESF
jgi:hypothetical protein